MGRWLLGWLCALCLASWAHAADGDCTAQIMSVQAARATPSDNARPAADSADWVPITLPDSWVHRWPTHSGSVWYRIDWQRSCAPGAAALAQPVGLSIAALTMAGAVYVNDALLWRDASLTAPLSHSWNTPRWWALPHAALLPGVNTVWVHVVGPVELASGLGQVALGDAAPIEAAHTHRLWRQRTAHFLAAALSSTVGCIFLVVWSLRREERAYGWFALMSLCWVFYLSTVLATGPWPVWPINAFADGAFESTLRMARLNLVAIVLYVLCFCVFTFRFGEQHCPRTERVLWCLATLGIAAILLSPRSALAWTSKLVFLGCVLVFFANCVQFQWHAWRTRSTPHLLLALCWLSFLVVGAHDLLVVFKAWHAHDSWMPLSSLFSTVFMALLLGGRLAAGLRQVERFNHTLDQHVTSARNELAQALAQAHTQSLEHTRLQERVQLAHDLHDGLGGSLVRSIAVVERAQRIQQPLPHGQVLSLLKLLRDDLRQMIDYGSSQNASVPATPEDWAAPLRHRFTRLFDELEIAWQWHTDAAWRSPHQRPSALQCLSMARILEEALSNTIKHSSTRHIRVTCTQPSDSTWRLCIEDDGRGFDAALLNDTTGLSMGVGMRSMAARAARIGGVLHVESRPGQGTQVRVDIALAPP